MNTCHLRNTPAPRPPTKSGTPGSFPPVFPSPASVLSAPGSSSPLEKPSQAPVDQVPPHGWKKEGTSRFLISAPNRWKDFFSVIAFIGGATILYVLKASNTVGRGGLPQHTSLSDFITMVAIGGVLLLVGFVLRSLVRNEWIVDLCSQSFRIRKSVLGTQFEGLAFHVADILEIGVTSRPMGIAVADLRPDLEKEESHQKDFSLVVLLRDGSVRTLVEFQNGALGKMAEQARFMGALLKKPFLACSEGSFLEIVPGSRRFRLRSYKDYHSSGDYIGGMFLKWAIILVGLVGSFIWLMSLTRVR